jgi:predicted O-methyltransferase YrrM
VSEKLWSEVDDYIVDRLVPPDPVMDAVLAANAAARLPPIDVSPAQGRFLELLVSMTGSRKVLEIGTLGGYSTIWMARALPEGGRIVTLEANQMHAMIARGNFKRAGVADRVELRAGPALETLPGVERDGLGPFDLVFIDADKPSNAAYLDWAVRLSHRGTVIVLDNVIREGEVVKEESGNGSVEGSRAAFDFLNGQRRLRATALQTVGSKGYDGFAIAIVD